jgi:hypothetical protein
MEAPSAPPGMSYNEYRTWRKSSGISSSMEELGEAWRAYSGGGSSRSPRRASPSRRSPPSRSSPKKSPKKSPKRGSPVRYGGLSTASLGGVPREVGALVSSHLSRGSVAAMRRTSKETSKTTDKKLRELCETPVTPRELLRVLGRLQLPITYILMDPGRRRLHQTVVPDEELVARSPEEITAYDLTSMEDAARVLASTGAQEVLLWPASLRQVLRHRLSCRDTALPSVLARRELVGLVTAGLANFLPAGSAHIFRDVDALLRGSEYVELRHPTLRQAEAGSLSLKLMLLHMNVTTNTEGDRSAPWTPPSLEGLTLEEVHEAFTGAFNVELDRLRAAYRSL